MNLGKWIPWNPLKQATGTYFIYDFVDSFEEGLKFIFSEENAKHKIEIHVSFGTIYACRKIKEMYTGRTYAFIINTHTNIETKWPIFIVENSEYLRYLAEESVWVTSGFQFKHYYIMDSEWAFDIASEFQPKIEFFADGILVEKLEGKRH
jgi:hypothetical protein